MNVSSDRLTLKAHYATLEVPMNASLTEVKSAYRRLARRFHPDLNPNTFGAAEQFKALTIAYEAISYHLNEIDSASVHSPKYTAPDRQDIQPNEIYNSFVDAFLGNIHRES